MYEDAFDEDPNDPNALIQSLGGEPDLLAGLPPEQRALLLKLAADATKVPSSRDVLGRVDSMAGPTRARAPQQPWPTRTPAPAPTRAGVMGVLGAPAAAMAGAMDTLIDQPGNLGAALRRGATELGAAPFQDQPLTVSQVTKQRGVDPGAAGSFLLDMFTDPSNFIGGDPTDLAKAGIGLAGMMGGVKNVAPEAVQASRGLYSRVDDALKLLPPKGAHPNKVASILKSNAGAEELAYRKVPEFLQQQGNTPVTPASLLAHLEAHPAPVPKVKTRGTLPADVMARRAAVADRLDVLAAQEPLTPALREESRQLSQEISQPLLPGKFSQYQVPGGENYRETLLTLPERAKPSTSSVTPESFPVEQVATGSAIQLPGGGIVHVGETRQGFVVGGMPGHFPTEAEAIAAGQQRAAEIVRQRSPVMREPQGFRSGHFDEPNILVHTRSNERTLPTGERGRFIEEVQSDWHQKGKKEGYALPSEVTTPMDAEYRALVRRNAEAREAGGQPLPADVERAQELEAALMRSDKSKIPNAPYKETWPDLGLKQQILEAAEDPNVSWIGHTSGQTQADRYDLSKQISRISFEPESHGDYSAGTLYAYDHQGKPVLHERGIEPHQFDDYLGKEPAENLRRQIGDTERQSAYDRKQWSVEPDADDPRYFNIIDPNGEVRHAYGGDVERYSEAGDAHDAIDELLKEDGSAAATIGGLDLQVGGEGMKHFYDQLLPKRLEKILKPFGGKVERGAVSSAPLPSSTDPEYLRGFNETRDPAANVPAWIARLTPEMKARILKEGLPLSALLALLAQSRQTETPQEPQ